MSRSPGKCEAGKTGCTLHRVVGSSSSNATLCRTGTMFVLAGGVLLPALGSANPALLPHTTAPVGDRCVCVLRQ